MLEAVLFFVLLKVCYAFVANLLYPIFRSLSAKGPFTRPETIALAILWPITLVVLLLCSILYLFSRLLSRLYR